MAFKIRGGSNVNLDSPERMFSDFSDRRLQGLLTHQGRVLADYQATALNISDVAIKLPTGSGKTLVGLLIAEWRRRSRGERVVYVCPTRQLVNQVVEEASAKYGMGDSILGFTGAQRDYQPASKARFHSAEAVAVTTYSGLFNANTFFDEPNIIVLDDAHAAENYLVDHWTLTINRTEHAALFQALVGVLQEVLPQHDLNRLKAPSLSYWDYSWVDLVPNERVAQIQNDLTTTIDAHVAETKLRYPWAVIRDHLLACQMYVGSQDIVFRPLGAMTLRYSAFRYSTQRIYMSATLGEGGDLERLTGVQRIHRLSVPDDFSAQGVGRRFFLFPGRSLTDDEQTTIQDAAIRRAGRAVVLVPDFRSAQEVTNHLRQALEVPTFAATEIENSKAPFVQSLNGVAVLANRYDGIDFPDDQCRLLVMRGLPGAANLQERFFLAKMSARLLLNDRIRTRVVQAVGRCTRSPTDYSAVVVLGEELLTYLSKSENRRFLHPELQAEIEFGLEQSKDSGDMLDNLDHFYRRTAEWRGAEDEIRRLRSTLKQDVMPALEQLAAAAPHEVAYQYAMWDDDPDGALEQARRVLTNLTDGALQGYRALWYYLAGSACSALARRGVAGQAALAREYYANAARAAPGVSWLRQLGGGEESGSAEPSSDSAAPLIERLELVLDRLGTLHDQNFERAEKMILEGLAASDAKTFEAAHVELGRMLGFEAGNKETSGSPDPWWIIDDSRCIVFEDHSDAEPGSKLSVRKARQVASHPTWMRSTMGFGGDAKVLPVLVTPVSEADKDAAIHLVDVAVWPLDEFRAWAVRAIQMIRGLRVRFPGPGDMVWRSQALEAYQLNGVDPDSLFKRLTPLGGSAVLK